MKRNTLIRALCALLCAALFIGTFSILYSTVGAAAPDDAVPVDANVVLAGDEMEAEPAVQADAEQVDAETVPSLNIFRRGIDWVFHTFGFIGFIFDPYQFTIINQKPVFQFMLGFNDFYDVFPWVVNVWADSLKSEFNYGGKDWRIQLWKGGYGVFFATGGEIGIYNKSENMPGEHYACPVSQSDWMDLKYTIYNRGKELFTRPSPYLSTDEGPYWWAPGYRILSFCTDFMSSPRKNVVMDATITLHSAEMAQLFIVTLKAKGFSELTAGSLGLSTPEKYQLMADGKSVRLIWQNINEGIY